MTDLEYIELALYRLRDKYRKSDRLIEQWQSGLCNDLADEIRKVIRSKREAEERSK
jgi:hypothetical protein